MGLAFGKKFSEDEKLAVSMCTTEGAVGLSQTINTYLSFSTARSIQTEDGWAGGHEGDHPVSYGSVIYHASSLYADKGNFYIL